MKLLGIVLVGLVAVVSAAPSWDTPAFCGELDCPKFTVKDKTDGYEVRVYEPSSWVTTKLTCDRSWFPQYTLFRRLLGYIQGQNVRSRTITMTAPVVMTTVNGGRPGCSKNITMSFFISPTAGSPPAPRASSEVHLQNKGRMTVYVKSFGGFQNGWRNNRYAQQLASALDRNGVNYKRGNFYVAGYDPPLRILNRHNEIWYIGA